MRQGRTIRPESTTTDGRVEHFGLEIGVRTLLRPLGYLVHFRKRCGLKNRRRDHAANVKPIFRSSSPIPFGYELPAPVSAGEEISMNYGVSVQIMLRGPHWG